MSSTQHLASMSQCADQELTERDAELLHAARAGSHVAFAELQSIYAHRIYKRILSITRNREDAEDALQDTFLRAYRALPTFEGRSKFSSWLTRIAINCSLMVLRKRRCCPEIAFQQQPLNSEDDGPMFDARDTTPGPEQIYDQSERCEAVWRAIHRLDPKLRNAMSIWIAHGNSVQEIARSLGVSSASVKARLYRARKRLAKCPDLRAYGEVLSSRRTSIGVYQGSGTEARNA